MKLEGENVLMRIFVDTCQLWHSRPVYEAIVELARKNRMAGATVLEGAEGFGQNGVLLKEQSWQLTNDKEAIVEIVDTGEKLEQFLRTIEPMLKDAIVTLERAHVIHYRTDRKGAQE